MTNFPVDCVLDFGATTGEGAVWSVSECKLYWVDIPRGKFCRFDPSTKSNVIWEMGQPIGCFALRESGGAIVALSNGFHEFDFETNALTFISDPEKNKPGNRFNDGTTDIRGRFIAGTMPIRKPSEYQGPQGSLYCLHSDLRVELLMDGFFVVNGLTFSPDGKTAYVSDSMTSISIIWAYDYDLDDASWSNKRVFFDTREVCGRPDGGTIDADGCYWMAGVGGWEIIRITPKGKIDMEIKMPVEKPTKIAFGGQDLDTIYVTSIGKAGITPGTHKKQPQAGGLFALKMPGIKGIPSPSFVG